MKIAITAALALSLLASGAALAQPRPYASDDRGDVRERQDERRWARGDRAPAQYLQNQYVVRDWRQRGLRQPPRGHRWVHDGRQNYYLVVIRTGVIRDAAYRDERDQRWKRRYARTYGYQDDVFYRECRDQADPAGVIIGALIGGLLGNAVGGDDGRGGSTFAGVILGGAVGAALTRDLNCEDRSYAYRAYYDGFNSGRVGQPYHWRNPRNDRRGEVRVRSYYNDPYGFRCASFTQTIYVQGRPRTARGRACRQPDGSWAVVN